MTRNNNLVIPRYSICFKHLNLVAIMDLKALALGYQMLYSMPEPIFPMHCQSNK